LKIEHSGTVRVDGIATHDALIDYADHIKGVDLDTALDSYHKVLQMNPQDWRAWYGIMESYGRIAKKRKRRKQQTWGFYTVALTRDGKRFFVDCLLSKYELKMFITAYENTDKYAPSQEMQQAAGKYYDKMITEGEISALKFIEQDLASIKEQYIILSVAIIALIIYLISSFSGNENSIFIIFDFIWLIATIVYFVKRHKRKKILSNYNK
jgi:hypothetical protein